MHRVNPMLLATKASLQQWNKDVGDIFIHAANPEVEIGFLQQLESSKPLAEIKFAHIHYFVAHIIILKIHEIL